MLLSEYPVAIRQILLYMKSTLENMGTVRKQHELTSSSVDLYNLKVNTCHIPLHSFPKA